MADRNPGRHGGTIRRGLAGAPHWAGGISGSRVPPRQRPHDHQQRASVFADGLPVHDQCLPRLLARLHLLFRPANPRVPGARDGRGLRAPDRRQGKCGRRARAELSSSRWRGDLIAMGTNTDPYQHAEGKYHLTRGIIGVLGERGNPFSILTKSTLVLRDLALLAETAQHTTVRVNLSIGTLDREVWRLTEPGTPPPDKRLDAVRRLNDAGVPCGVLVAPVLPGLSDADEQVTAVVEASRAAGAVAVSIVGLHLRPGVRQHYLDWLANVRPDLMDLYARRFRHGSYQPRREQDRLSALVAQVMGVGPGGSRREPGISGADGADGADGAGNSDRRAAPQPPAKTSGQLKLFTTG